MSKPNGKCLSKAELMELGQPKVTRYPVPWGDSFILDMTQRQLDFVQAQDNPTAWYLCFCVADENGNRIWGDHDIDAIAGLKTSVTLPLMKAVTEVALGSIDPDEYAKN